MKEYINKGILSLVLILLLCGSCTKLDEQLYGRLSPENFYKNEAEVLSALAGVYNSMGFTVNGGNGWRLLHLGTDEFLIPARSDGRWFDGGVYLEFSKHQWTPANNRISSGWTEVFGAIGTANAIIQSLQNSPNKDNLKAQIAEARGVRAYAYFFAMDLWGNVPIVTTARIDPKNLPANKTRKEVFDFVVQELTEASADLPSAKTVNKATYYPRMTKEAAYAILAITYLNAEVYTGTAKWAECIAMCNNIIDSKAYTLTTNYFDNFKPNNEGSSEFIYAISVDPTKMAGGNNFAQRVLHDSHRFKYGLPFTPQNGFTTLEEAFNRYENQDVRKTMILNGPQLDANGNPLKNIAGTANLVLIPHQNQENAAENEGFRVLKWLPDATWINGAAGNDVATIRYAEI
ncbi:MAG: RagB/SusD family nutrient uptake outer membrane protein, partial [Flavisolibacter sp.]|nr:RagB/SusD family nutrient uptake outer membrane protein [Flavisolibacter sp.]